MAAQPAHDVMGDCGTRFVVAVEDLSGLWPALREVRPA
jgi:hypothetical protein